MLDKHDFSPDPIELDGRTLEGGGQLLRIALCLSALTGLRVRIHDIRGNRSGGGGLKAQHLACVNWLAYACGARVDGAERGSKTLLFEPGKATGFQSTELSPAFRKVTKDGESMYECRLDIGTAGSTGLALQAVLPFILFAALPSELPVRLTLSGGTNVSGSPSYEYISQVLLPTLQTIGFPGIRVELGKRGWSHGGSSVGNFTLEIPPRSSRGLPAFERRPQDLTARAPRPSHLQATFIAPTSCLGHFRTVLLPAVQHHFGKSYSFDRGNLDIVCEASLDEKRMYLILIATLATSRPAQTYKLARDWLYERKIRSHERTATEMAERVTNELANECQSGAWADEHMRDQLVIFQALAEGKSAVFAGVEEDGASREPSLHARTAEWVAKRMLGVRFDAEGSCEGVGFGMEENAGSKMGGEGGEEVLRRLENLDVG